MDVLYHGVIGFTIAKSFGGGYEIPAIISAIIPDIVGTAPFFFFKLQRASKKSLKIFTQDAFRLLTSNTFSNTIDCTVYQITHSFITAFLITIISYVLFRPAWIIISLNYISHILIDIPTHDGEFSTYFLYPLSTYHKENKNWAKSPKIFLTWWGGLILLLLFSCLHYHKSRIY